MDGKLVTYENNSMSLSCRGELTIKNGIIIQAYLKGMPRTSGDEWTGFYKNAKIGGDITQGKIDEILSYNGKRNVVSSFDS